MSDRVPSDLDAVPSHRVRLTEVGRTGRLAVPLPDAVEATVEDVVVLSLEGAEVHAPVAEDLRGDRRIEGAFENARLARTAGEGEDRLSAWASSVGVAAGDRLLLDVLAAGYAFGLRRPGERVLYRARDPPDADLADIARDLEG